MRNKYISFLSLIVLSFYSYSAAAAVCSPADIISLANSGYGKQEINRLCGEKDHANKSSAFGVQELAVSDIPKGANYQGNVVRAISWDDALGVNYLLQTLIDVYQVDGRKGKMCDDESYCFTTELYGYHYVNNGSGLKRLWRIYDLVKECSFDINLQFLPGSLEVTDLDRNGVAETAFVYRLACRGDVSGSAMKLMMHEGKKKLAIRGSTMTPIESGMMNVDPAFNSVPAIFRTYAVQRWNMFNKEFFDLDLEGHNQ
ncbi:MAG: hypothetical protein GY814_04870 [Gammaproteobacteria bacterium]|nr:hypothetical protein [Gammaproteobacteria bacterium]